MIVRCLESVKPWIHSWVIVDTGSTDGTQDLVRETLQGLPGALFQRPWRDFGSNRSEAIRLAGSRADYLLFLDADEQWLAPEGYHWPRLEAGVYRVMRRYLFVESASAAWRNRDEYAVACYWAGRRDEAARVCRELLQDGSLPEGERARVEANLGFALD